MTVGVKVEMGFPIPNLMGLRVRDSPRRKRESERLGLLGGDVETSCLLDSDSTFRVTSCSHYGFVRECDNDAERSPKLDYKREVGGRLNGVGYPSPG